MTQVFTETQPSNLQGIRAGAASNTLNTSLASPQKIDKWVANQIWNKKKKSQESENNHSIPLCDHHNAIQTQVPV